MPAQKCSCSQMSCTMFSLKQVLEHSRSDELLAAVQHVDTGELLMQAFADRAAISETLQTGLATFYSRSRKVGLRWS